MKAKMRTVVDNDEDFSNYKMGFTLLVSGKSDKVEFYLNVANDN